MMARTPEKGISRDLQRHLGHCMAREVEPVLNEDLTAHMVTLLDLLDRRDNVAAPSGRKKDN